MTMHPSATSGLAHAPFAAQFFFLAFSHLVLTAANPLTPPPTNTGVAVVSRFATSCRAFLSHSTLLEVFKASPRMWEMIALTTLCGLLVSCRWTRERLLGTSISIQSTTKISSTHKADPGLLKKHSTIQTYQTSIARYPAIRTFYHPHPHGAKLPTEPKPLPLFVFIHGLGGSVAQFNNLLTSLINVAPCFSIDLPGAGLSEFAPSDWNAYSHLALVELLDVAIARALERAGTREALLVCHSMGCSLAVSLQTNPSGLELKTQDKISGIIAICPKASLPTVEQVRSFGKLLRVPTPIFDLWRAWDRRGGIDSASVSRFVGAAASVETRKLQLKFNEQSKTAVWRRMARGAVPVVTREQLLSGGLPGPEAWAMVSVPLLVVAGESDKVTKSDEAAVIARALGRDTSYTKSASSIPVKATNSVDHEAATTSTNSSVGSSDRRLRKRSDTESLSAEENAFDELDHVKSVPLPRKAVLKTTVLPDPASHGLLYDEQTYRTLSGLIQTFVADHIDERLSLGWQLQHLKDANKWDVKNLAKWKAVTPVSDAIGGIFHAMKTLREVDDVHSPTTFVCEWSSKIRTVIDISHENPVYSPDILEGGGVEYIKFPTVSKIPPTEEEVREFIALVDRLREEEKSSDEHRMIGVHCHYGFNRTGFFICSYLIERERYGVQQALDEFKARRPPGIRHEHFIDTLFVRYCVGLRRAPTM